MTNLRHRKKTLKKVNRASTNYEEVSNEQHIYLESLIILAPHNLHLTFSALLLDFNSKLERWDVNSHEFQFKAVARGHL